MTFQNVAFSKAIWWFHKCMFWQQQWEVEWFKYSLLTLKFLLFQNLTRLFSKIQNIMNFGNFYIEAWEYMSARTESIIPLAFSNRSIVPHYTLHTQYNLFQVCAYLFQFSTKYEVQLVTLLRNWVEFLSWEKHFTEPLKVRWPAVCTTVSDRNYYFYNHLEAIRS